VVDLNYTRQGEVFRAVDPLGNSKRVPLMLVGAHSRVYKGSATIDCTGANAQPLQPPAGSTFAEITAEGAADTDFARYWHYGTPSGTVGVKLYNRDTFVSADPANFKAIKGSTGTGVTLRVEFFAYE